MKVIVGSKNPVKLGAVVSAFEAMFPGISFEFEGVSVASGVSDQPMSEEETLEGAEIRARNARESSPEATYWVGVEGGLEKDSFGLRCFSWVVVLGNSSCVGKGSSGSFYLPAKISSLIADGKTLGEADDLVFDRKDSSKKAGAIGLLTGGVINRETFYFPAVVRALIPHLNSDLYPHSDSPKHSI
ncbi:inosine/xanthosine triphosphatase [candidate division WWE3 bacterium]|nr:inosine/xanthosine triphosphatase [candidate division WWE3 bacterium]